MKKKLAVAKTFNTDSLMKTTWSCLARDFQSFETDPEIQAAAEVVADTRSFRRFSWSPRMSEGVHRFKQKYQLETLFKRYTFADDLLTAEERERATFDKFMEHQLSMSSGRPHSVVAHRVLQRARKIIRGILGKYSEEEMFAYVQYGKRAASGVPAKHAYLDVKMGNSSCSVSQSRVFGRYLKTDAVFADYYSLYLSEVMCNDFFPESMHRTAYRQGNDLPPFWFGSNDGFVDTLAMTNVPKSYKIDRGIVPTTVIGTLFTGAIGRYIREKCKMIFDIRKLQTKHRIWAKRYSETKKYVTADLSNASNSFPAWIINALVPRDWYHALSELRIPNYSYKDQTYFGMSYMMMGIGYTFDLETLLFYAIVKAVEELLELPSRRISVYGDDLIYHRDLHRHLVYVLDKLGFTINEDKTFVWEPFRESCGGDYYRGIDVRPFQPEGQYKELRRSQYVPLVYKTINGLLARWLPEEIPITLNFLYKEVLRIDKHLLCVPPDSPAHAGIKSLDKMPWYVPVCSPRWFADQQRWVYPAYELVREDRFVLSEFAYYWDKLRSMSQDTEDFTRYEAPPEVMRTVIAPKQPRNYRAFFTKKRIKLRSGVVSRKNLCVYSIRRPKTESPTLK